MFDSFYSDERLINEVTKGNKNAFNELVKRHQHKLYQFIWQMVLEQNLTEDIVQSTLTKVWQKSHLFNPDKNVKFNTWLFTIARNLTLDELRKKTHFEPLDDDDFICQKPTPNQTYEHNQQLQSLHQSLNKLSTNDRSVLNLYYFEHKSYEDIGRILAMNKPQVKYHLKRAKISLEDELRRDNG